MTNEELEARVARLEKQANRWPGWVHGLLAVYVLVLGMYLANTRTRLQEAYSHIRWLERGQTLPKYLTSEASPP